MERDRQHNSERPSERAHGTPIEGGSVVLGVATLPVLLGTAAAATAVEVLRALGETSEEIFRGDRLPVLPIPPVSASEPTDASEAGNVTNPHEAGGGI